MKLSEAIRTMQRAKKEHGDIEVVGVFENAGEFGYSFIPYLRAALIPVNANPNAENLKLKTVFAVSAFPPEDETAAIEISIPDSKVAL